MRYYFYEYKGAKHGPFTIEELRNKRLSKSTMIWTEGMSDWAIADSIEELKEILISEPPLLPGEIEEKFIENGKRDTIP